MTSPYTPVSVSGFNSSPPSDDAAATDANKVKWSTIKTKLADPLNTAIVAIDANVAAAFTALPPRSIFTFSMVAQTVPAGVTYFIGSSLVSPIEQNLQIPAPYKCVMRNLYANSSVVPGGGETFAYTLRKNLADTAVTCTTSGGGSSGSIDSTHQVSYAQGDTFDIKVVSSAGAGVGVHWLSIEVEATT